MKKLLLLALFLMLSSCELLQLTAPTPTATLMKGVWQVTELYDISSDTEDSTVNMIDSIGLGYRGNKVPQYFDIQEDGTVTSTAGPLMLYIVYGNGNYTNFTAKLDDIFNYADYKFTNGEWRIEDGTVDNFEIQMKLSPPGMKTLTDILELFGVNTQKIKTYLIHRFYKVDVDISNSSKKRMEWIFSDSTDARYFVQGNSFDTDEEWAGWDAHKFTRCKLVLEKQVGTLQDLIGQ